MHMYLHSYTYCVYKCIQVCTDTHTHTHTHPHIHSPILTCTHMHLLMGFSVHYTSHCYGIIVYCWTKCVSNLVVLNSPYTNLRVNDVNNHKHILHASIPYIASLPVMF